jgi:acyl carrier protein
VTATEHVYASLREVLETGAFDDDTALVALGDSLALVAIVMELEERLELQIPDGTELAWTSVGDVVRWAESATERRPS